MEKALNLAQNFVDTFSSSECRRGNKVQSINIKPTNNQRAAPPRASIQPGHPTQCPCQWRACHGARVTVTWRLVSRVTCHACSGRGGWEATDYSPPLHWQSRPLDSPGPTTRSPPPAPPSVLTPPILLLSYAAPPPAWPGQGAWREQSSRLLLSDCPVTIMKSTSSLKHHKWAILQPHMPHMPKMHVMFVSSVRGWCGRRWYHHTHSPQSTMMGLAGLSTKERGPVILTPGIPE